MISLDSKTKTSKSSSLLDVIPQETPKAGGLSFSDLLHGVSLKKEAKVAQNGVFVLALDGKSVQAPTQEIALKDVKSLGNEKTSKTDSLLSLLQGDVTSGTVQADNKKEVSEVIILNPDVSKNMKPSELKVLIHDAKQYLKDKISKSVDFKKSEIEALPKTLKGLLQVTKKLGIDVSKITLEDVRPVLKTQVKAERAKAKTGIDIISMEQKADKPKAKLEPVVFKVALNIADIKQEVKQAPKVEQKLEPKVELKPQTKERADTKVPTTILPKETPLFKRQTASSEITTQQLMSTKINTIEVKSPKIQKQDETLKLLLQGKKASKQVKGLTADFSLATAGVIASETITKSNRTVESLLHGDAKDNLVSNKVDSFQIPKADSLDVKMHEAKQMTKYISQDIKTAINDYKSPFTRLKVELHPQRLGSVELIVVQRGKNLHINLSSNNAAINALALNSNDLKIQLNNNGINNATLNFNNNSQGLDMGFSGQQQQNHQNGREAQREYGYFGKEEVNEEILDSLEIVVPSYA